MCFADGFMVFNRFQFLMFFFVMKNSRIRNLACDFLSQQNIHIICWIGKNKLLHRNSMKIVDSRTNSKLISAYGCRTNSHCEKSNHGRIELTHSLVRRFDGGTFAHPCPSVVERLEEALFCRVVLYRGCDSVQLIHRRSFYQTHWRLPYSNETRAHRLSFRHCMVHIGTWKTSGSHTIEVSLTQKREIERFMPKDPLLSDAERKREV